VKNKLLENLKPFESSHFGALHGLMSTFNELYGTATFAGHHVLLPNVTLGFLYGLIRGEELDILTKLMFIIAICTTCLVEAFECKFTDFHSHNMALISSLKELNQMSKYGKRKIFSMKPVTMKLAGPFYSSLKYSFLLTFIQTVLGILTDLLIAF